MMFSHPSLEFSNGAIVAYAYIPFIALQIIIFSKHLHKLHCSRKKVTTLQKVLHNTCMMAVILTSIFDALHGAGAMMTGTRLLGADQETVQWVTNMEILADVFYYTNSLLLYFILVDRLRRTFRNTTLSISEWIFGCIGVAMFFQFALMVLYILNLAIYNCAVTKWCKRLGFTAACIMINDYILNVILFSLFIRKLKDVRVCSNELSCFLECFLEHIQIGHKFFINRAGTTIQKSVLDIQI